MKKLIRQSLLLMSLFFLSFLVSCGGGSSSSGSADGNSVAQSTGSVGILLTDKPADLSLFRAVNVTIESIVLIGDEEHVQLYDDLNVTYNLLDLRNESLPLIFEDNIPVGRYCKVRLTLSDLELVMTNGSVSSPRMTGNRKIDLLARDCFTVDAGEMLTLQIDIDAGNSVHINGSNNGYNFRPVVFIDVLGDDFTPKLVRVDGVVFEVDAETGTLQICGAVPDSDGLGCVQINVGENTGYFDKSESDAGSAQPLSALYSESLIGETVTVVGWPQHDVQTYGEEKDADHPCMSINALVIEHGEFIQVAGDISTVPDDLGFDLDVSQDEGGAYPELFAVQYFSAPDGGNGTRIVTKAGDLLTSSELEVAAAVQIDGALATEDDTLNAALVIVDSGAVTVEQVSGVVASVSTDDDSFVLTPDTDTETVCSSPVADVTVLYGAETSFLTVTVTDDESLVEHGGTLIEERAVNVSGVCESEGLSAAVIVLIDDQTTVE